MMRISARLIALAAASLLLVLVVACGEEEAEPDSTPAATGTSAATTAEPTAAGATATRAAATGSPSPAPAEETPGQAAPAATAAPSAETIATPPPPAPGAPTEPAAAPALSAEEARDKLGRATILMDDLDPGYMVETDEYDDNEAASAAQTDPAQTLTFLNDCGRVLGRTVVYVAEDMTQAALSGQSVSFFANANAFQDPAGASEYYAASSGMIGQGLGLEAMFADVFADPGDVEVVPTTVVDLGDESCAFTLNGETEAAGQLYPIAVLMIVLRRGPVTAFVGSIRVGLPPEVQATESLAQLLVDRVDQEF
jgi:hypothetical protein